MVEDFESTKSISIGFYRMITLDKVFEKTGKRGLYGVWRRTEKRVLSAGAPKEELEGRINRFGVP